MFIVHAAVAKERAKTSPSRRIAVALTGLVALRHAILAAVALGLIAISPPVFAGASAGFGAGTAYGVDGDRRPFGDGPGITALVQVDSRAKGRWYLIAGGQMFRQAAESSEAIEGNRQLTFSAWPVYGGIAFQAAGSHASPIGAFIEVAPAVVPLRIRLGEDSADYRAFGVVLGVSGYRYFADSWSMELRIRAVATFSYDDSYRVLSYSGARAEGLRQVTILACVHVGERAPDD